MISLSITATTVCTRVLTHPSRCCGIGIRLIAVYLPVLHPAACADRLSRLPGQELAYPIERSIRCVLHRCGTAGCQYRVYAKTRKGVRRRHPSTIPTQHSCASSRLKDTKRWLQSSICDLPRDTNSAAHESSTPCHHIRRCIHCHAAW